jgi:hypothetical protein
LDKIKKNLFETAEWKIRWIFSVYKDRCDLLVSGIQIELVFNWMERSPQGRWSISDVSNSRQVGVWKYGTT